MPSVIDKKGKVVADYAYSKKGIREAEAHAARIGGTVKHQGEGERSKKPKGTADLKEEMASVQRQRKKKY
jgi:hypothetical protein